MEERLNNLETILAIQDETIAALNKELFHQQQNTTNLQRRIERLEQRIEELQPTGEMGTNERPPHY